MQSGELTVSGTNSIHISLEHMPAEVKVYFEDDDRLIPCNPHVDTLEYSVHTTNTHRHGFVLIINWSVSNLREVRWHALF